MSVIEGERNESIMTPSAFTQEFQESSSEVDRERHKFQCPDSAFCQELSGNVVESEKNSKKMKGEEKPKLYTAIKHRLCNLMSYVAGEDAAEKTAFEEQVKQLEKLKEDRLKKLKNEEDQIFFESRGPVVHDTGETSGGWELTCTGPGSRMNEISRLVSQSDIIKQMSKEARIKKTDMQIEATELMQEKEHAHSKY